MTLFEFLVRQYITPDATDRYMRRHSSIDIHNQADAVHRRCSIWASKVEGIDDGVLLQMTQMPIDGDLADFLEELNCTVDRQADRAKVQLQITAADSPRIRRIAKQIRQLVGPGTGYRDRNWKWVCPRTSDTLAAFAGHLRSYRAFYGKPTVAAEAHGGRGEKWVIQLHDARRGWYCFGQCDRSIN